MPAFKAATDSANAYMDMLSNQLYSMQVEYQRKLNEYDSLQKTWSPLIKGLKEKEIRDLENNIQAFQQQAQDDYTAYRAKLYAPIFKQIDNAVKDIALAHGYKYVLDSTVGNGVLYAADGPENIFTEVRVKLKIPEPPKPAPGPAPGGTPAPGGH
jgi:outer membrane protein